MIRFSFVYGIWDRSGGSIWPPGVWIGVGVVGSWCVGGGGVGGPMALGWGVRVWRNGLPSFWWLPFRVADSQSGWWSLRRWHPLQVSHSDSGSGSGILRDSLRGNISFVLVCLIWVVVWVLVLGWLGLVAGGGFHLLLLLGYPGGRMPGAKVLERVGFASWGRWLVDIVFGGCVWGWVKLFSSRLW